jgi:hypothetical protein
MMWFLLEVLVALVIAVVIVWWTMGTKQREPPANAGRRDSDAR